MLFGDNGGVDDLFDNKRGLEVGTLDPNGDAVNGCCRGDAVLTSAGLTLTAVNSSSLDGGGGVGGSDCGEEGKETMLA